MLYSSAVLQIEFVPISIGTHDHSLTLTTNGPKSTRQLQFGTILPGSSEALYVEIRNFNVKGTPAVSPTLDTPSYRISSNTCPAAGLPDHYSCGFVVTFKPKTQGT